MTSTDLAKHHREGPVPDFWQRSGYHLLDRNEAGQLVVTDDFLRAYFDRAEIRPIETSCAEEIALHRELMADPLMFVPRQRLAALADPDGRENYEVVLAFREQLIRHPTLEAFYLDRARGHRGPLPQLFLDHLVQVILRGVLDGCDDPFRLRAAEILFRTQKVSITEGTVMMADEETVEMRAAQNGAGSGGALLTQDSPVAANVELDVLNGDNLATYWQRSDRFDTVFEASLERFGLDALSRVLERWVDHFLGVAVSIQPVARISDERWRWHVGLDAESSAILNDLYESREVDEARLARVVALFRLEFKDAAAVVPEVAGRPVYLGMAMTADGRLRLKPQNLLVNLPITPAA
jgi:hypothetical protein